MVTRTTLEVAKPIASDKALNASVPVPSDDDIRDCVSLMSKVVVTFFPLEEIDMAAADPTAYLLNARDSATMLPKEVDSRFGDHFARRRFYYPTACPQASAAISQGVGIWGGFYYKDYDLRVKVNFSESTCAIVALPEFENGNVASYPCYVLLAGGHARFYGEMPSGNPVTFEAADKMQCVTSSMFSSSARETYMDGQKSTPVSFTIKRANVENNVSAEFKAPLGYVPLTAAVPVVLEGTPLDYRIYARPDQEYSLTHALIVFGRRGEDKRSMLKLRAGQETNGFLFAPDVADKIDTLSDPKSYDAARWLLAHAQGRPMNNTQMHQLVHLMALEKFTNHHCH